jgi:hypothetical protein
MSDNEARDSSTKPEPRCFNPSIRSELRAPDRHYLEVVFRLIPGLENTVSPPVKAREVVLLNGT